MVRSSALSSVSITVSALPCTRGLLCGTLESEYNYWGNGKDWTYLNEDGAMCNVYENELAGPFIDAMNSRSNMKSFTAALPESWQVPEASWRNMLFTQPPFIGDVDIYQLGCPPCKRKYAHAPLRTAEDLSLIHI